MKIQILLKFCLKWMKRICFRNKKQLILISFILFCTLSISGLYKHSPSPSKLVKKAIFYVGTSEEDGVHVNNINEDTYLKNQRKECRIPQLNPFDDSIKHLLKNKSSVSYGRCESQRFPFLFNSTLEATIVPQKEESYFREILKLDTCCYRTVERDSFSWDPDNSIRYGDECFPISLSNPTVIPPEHEFIAIHCKEFGEANGTVDSDKKNFGEVYDVHAFVPLKPEAEKRILSIPEEIRVKKKFNVVIFGIDSVSRMNFLRTMQESHAFLVKNLSAIEMTGYNKVGENTFPNVAPLLTSKTGQNLKRTCLLLRWLNGYNGCPFIWDDFARRGYYTSYTEDIAYVAAFNFKNSGFRKEPTDFYTRAFINSVVKEIATNTRVNVYDCYGPRHPFDIWLDYMKKLFYTMKKHQRNFFHYSWSTSIGHDDLHHSFLGDLPLLETLQWLKEFNYLKNTIFILLSDHGHRMHPIRQTIQGQFEDRLPLMFFLIPESFKEDYRRAYNNLASNRDKLITAFDLHETLNDILNLDDIEEVLLQKRTLELSLLENVGQAPRGISLFLPISKFRTCEDAGIKINFCSCLEMESSRNDTIVKNLTEMVVMHINDALIGYKQCAKLELENVTMAQHSGGNERYTFEAYFLNFQTSPGGGLYEAVVSRKRSNQAWEVTGPVTRTNSYKEQSYCVEDAEAKPFCICLN